MYLKEIKMSGFKSFADKLDIKLNDEIYEFEAKNNDLIKIESYSYLKDDEFVIYDVPDTETKKVNKFSIFIMIMLGYTIIKYGKI